MARQLLVGTRKGLFRRRPARPRLAHRARRAARRSRSRWCSRERDGTLHARAGHGPLRRQDEALARRRRDVGRAARAAVPAEARRRRRHRSDAQHADPLERHEGAGRSKRRSATASSGAARFRAACSTRATAATAGSSSRACGSIRTASSGSAAAPTIPASTRSSSTRAAPTSCRIGVSCGGLWLSTDGGDIVGLQRPGHARRLRAARSSVRAPRPGRASRRAMRRGARTTSGSSITTASSAAPTAG